MINSIGQQGAMFKPERSEQPLSDTQQQLITDTLAEFDADNLSEEEAKSIVESFQQANIQPGSQLESAMSALGFDAKTIGDLAHDSQEGSRATGLQNSSDFNLSMPPPPKQSTEEISSMVDYLAQLLEEKIASNADSTLSDEDKESVVAQVLEKFNKEQGDSIINTTA